MSTSPTRHSNRGNKPKLLVVDDEPDNLDLLYRTFYRQFQVLRAERGRHALEILAQQPDIAIIISDQRMPEMAGTEFLGQAAQQYPDVMRIILTGYTDSEDLVEAINQGQVFKYVTKPWDEDDLRETVQQALDAHNLIKTRTADLNRVLRQETLLNTITHRIRSAQTPQDMLQTIVDVVGRSLEVSYCSIRPYCAQPSEESCFTYRADAVQALATENSSIIAQTLWPTDRVLVLESVLEASGNQIPDAQERLSAFAALGIQSSVLVPLISRKDLVAVMALHRCQLERPWAADDLQLLITLADQAALALAQAYTYEQVQALARREALINTITSAIRSSLNPRKTFAAITGQLGQALQVDGCALSLWTEQDDYVCCVGLYDAQVQVENLAETSEEQEVTQLPKSQVPIAENPVLQKLIATREPVVLNSLDDRTLSTQSDLSLQNPARALLVAPLMADGKIIGSISLRQVHQARIWQPEEIELVKVVASQAAIAVQQARLFQATKANEQRIAELNQYLTESVLKRFLPESLVTKAAQGDLRLDLQPEPR
ncbi:guanylate cyclase, partial [filamentous cyanobacterium CCT1]